MNPVHNAAFKPTLLLIGVALIGCTPNSSDGPPGPATDAPLLSQFAGQWVFDFDKTLAAQKAAGSTDDKIAQLRKLYADHPMLGKMHPDLTIKGNVAVGSGTPSSEYRFFAMHNHDSRVCGKAWHHEDRLDPGDMSKCFVRLSVVGGDLRLEVNMLDGLPDVNDPDLLSTPAVEGDVSRCDASKQKAGDWATYVFSRRT
jgi:hypothetical protein